MVNKNFFHLHIQWTVLMFLGHRTPICVPSTSDQYKYHILIGHYCFFSLEMSTAHTDVWGKVVWGWLCYQCVSRLLSLCLMLTQWMEGQYSYNVIWSLALHKSTYRSPLFTHTYIRRVHCPISLPQPLLHSNLISQTTYLSNVKTVISACAIFIPVANAHMLAHPSKSPYEVINGEVSVTHSGNRR